MRPLSPILASLANAFKIPVSSPSRPAIRLSNNVANEVTGRARQFSSTTPVLAKKRGGKGGDRRIKLIRYFLYHPLTPRPLRFSRTRYLRHWTIHRAWQLYQASLRRAQELELQRQWQAMRAACEELRTGAGDGGKLFRVSMNKKGVFTDLIPIEYGRLQTEGPATSGWNYDWKRVEKHGH
ncbi:hypothetical protein MPDQ_003564 [Monascus purpureus]|uniref:54S ribosomal protein L28, mitochondrial n=1 Tax=Monascus purpureus TaxID=5098 RepID=A0A507QKR9_MONPU|nr:hypothetical protein MPDQ_003564 [Monascus purpureus]BDD56869.1 hypothetical protein MAP00_002286 [Monascus purpureus]